MSEPNPVIGLKTVEEKFLRYNCKVFLCGFIDELFGRFDIKSVAIDSYERSPIPGKVLENIFILTQHVKTKDLIATDMKQAVKDNLPDNSYDIDMTYLHESVLEAHEGYTRSRLNDDSLYVGYLIISPLENDIEQKPTGNDTNVETKLPDNVKRFPISIVKSERYFNND